MSSILTSGTSLRSLRELRLGKPTSMVAAQRTKAAAPKPEGHRRAGRTNGEQFMVYVYILCSIADPEPVRFYVGVTEDLRSRLKKQNAGAVPHTSKYAPWAIKTYVAFSDRHQAFAFEK